LQQEQLEDFKELSTGGEEEAGRNMGAE